MWRDGERGHLTRAIFGVGVQSGATKNNAIVFDDGVFGNVTFHFCAFTAHQGAVVLEGLYQLQHTTQIIRGGFAQAFKPFVHHHGANAVMHIDLEQQHTIHRKRQDVAALHA